MSVNDVALPSTFQGRFVPWAGRSELPFVTVANLRTFLNREAPKQFNEKAKIKFIDCQSAKHNSGKQFKGALHVDFDDIPSEALSRFKSLITSIPNVYNDVGDADVVIVYCQYGQNRSPAVASLYMSATADPNNQPQKLKKGQRVLILDGGMTEYQKVTSQMPIVNYLLPKAGKILATGPVKPLLPKFIPPNAGDSSVEGDEVDMIYTDAA